MSDAIKNLEKVNARQLETLKQRQASEIKAREKSHVEYKSELKKAHENDYVILKEENARELESSALRKERIINDMKSNLQHTHEITDKQLKALKENGQGEELKFKEKLSDDRSKAIAEHDLYMEDINQRYQQQIKRVNTDGRSRVEDIDASLRQEYNSKEAEYEKKLAGQSSNFREQFQRHENEHTKIKSEVESRNKRERLSTNQGQQLELAKMTVGHQSALEARELNFRKGQKDQDLFFEKRFIEDLKVRNDDLKRLDELHGKVVQKMKNDLSKELVQSVNRSDDPFFQFTELRPTLKDFPDKVEIKLSVPEHAKQDVQLTTNNKEAIVTFNRRYTDSNVSAEGNVNRVNKVETFTSKVNTGAHLDPKNVKSTYEGGVMTYVIRKA